SSGSSTRSTPARFSPSSFVISWMRRSFSPSSCEYRRVPFGERLGSMRPRASYMRSVCGCISASSAATEIMKTPRSEETVTRVVRRRPAISAPHLRLCEQVGPGVAVDDLRELVDRLGLLLVQRCGHVDHEAVVDVAARRPRRLVQPRRPLAAQAL